MMRAQELADRIGSGWPVVLEQLGIAPEYLVNRHGPCPACGGKDRYRFDNRHGRGDYFCNGCGAGSGYDLLMRVHGWDFRTARDRVAEAAVVGARPSTPPIRVLETEQSVSHPTQRVLRLWRQTCAPVDCSEAADYLAHRGLWPLPPECRLRAHPSAEYFVGMQRVGRYGALLADVRDLAGELVTVHITYLERARKLTEYEPRKILSPLSGRIGCAVRLMPLIGDTLGVAEGIETALSASRIHGVPTWSVLNAALLTKFEPPAQVRKLIVFADADVAGLGAAARLAERLQGRVHFEIKAPPDGRKDWNDIKTQGVSDADH
jgi:putative DNA primase/helicase